MTLIRIMNDRVEVIHGGSILGIELHGYDSQKHQVEFLDALKKIHFIPDIKTLSCNNIHDEKIVDVIIDLLYAQSFTSFYIHHSDFRQKQISRLLSCPTIIVTLVFSHITFQGEGGTDEIIPRDYLCYFELQDCEPSFVQYVLSTVRIHMIRGLSIWLHGRLDLALPDPELISHFIGSCTIISSLSINHIDIPTLFNFLLERRNPVQIHTLVTVFDWMTTDNDTANRFADVMCGLYTYNRLIALQNDYSVPNDLALDHISARLRLFTARTFNRLKRGNFKLCSYQRLEINQYERFVEEEKRLSTLPYEQMLILLAAKQKQVGTISALPKDVLSLLSEMLGTT